jgi:hypothetical protein
MTDPIEATAETYRAERDAARQALIAEPAECYEGCDDDNCPYSHLPLTWEQAAKNAAHRASTAETERDAARAEVERLREAMASAVDRKAAASFVQNWLETWAAALAETRDEYIVAQRTGIMGKRRISPDDARAFAKQFRERSDAVWDCGEQLAAAILCLPAPTPTTTRDDPQG